MRAIVCSDKDVALAAWAMVVYSLSAVGSTLYPRLNLKFDLLTHTPYPESLHSVLSQFYLEAM